MLVFISGMEGGKVERIWNLLRNGRNEVGSDYYRPLRKEKRAFRPGKVKLNVAKQLKVPLLQILFILEKISKLNYVYFSRMFFTQKSYILGNS